MADEDLRAAFPQAFDVGVVARVRALHLVADIDQDLGDPGHADSADADEVDGADFVRQLHVATVSGAAGGAASSHQRQGIGQFAEFGKWGGQAGAGWRACTPLRIRLRFWLAGDYC